MYSRHIITESHQAKAKTLSQREFKAFIAKDKAILVREAKAINAEVQWQSYYNRFEITVSAPTGFAWACSNEPILRCTHERLSPDAARETVRELLLHMEHGYVRSRSHDVSDEDSEWDEDEPKELDFD